MSLHVEIGNARTKDSKIAEKASRSRTLWDDKFNELKEYKSKHQHCNVHQKSGPLGAWVAKQRYEYLRKQKKEPSQMTDDRIKLLEEIGFNWTLTLG